MPGGFSQWRSPKPDANPTSFGSRFAVPHGDVFSGRLKLLDASAAFADTDDSYRPTMDRSRAHSRSRSTTGPGWLLPFVSRLTAGSY